LSVFVVVRPAEDPSFIVSFKWLTMNPVVSILMGSTSDFEIMEKAASLLNEFEIPFEINALSAHRTPDEVEQFAHGASERGIRVIIAGAGMAAHLPGVVASYTTIPVIGVPINAGLGGIDALLSIIQMPPGIPVATVGINASMNAALLAVQILALQDEEIAGKLAQYKKNLKKKIVLANESLKGKTYPFRTNA
jgi:5-(carboxyamino)imidazole ribonucleotide mutase